MSSWDHINEIDVAPDTTLSLLAAAKELIQPGYTMANFNWMGQRLETGPLLKTLRNRLTGHLSALLPDIRHAMSEFFDRIDGPQPDDSGEEKEPN